MKRLFTWAFLLCWAVPVFAQWEDTQGPANISITKMASRTDSIYCINGGKIYASSADNVSWQMHMNGISNQVSLVELRQNADMLITIGNSQPYFLFKDSNTWKRITQGLPNNEIFSTLYTFNNEHVFIEYYIEDTNNYSVYKLSQNRESWIEIPALENSNKLSFAYDPKNGFMAAYDRTEANSLYIVFIGTSANGILWKADTVVAFDTLDLTSLVYHDSLIIASNVDYQLLQTSDFGLTWKKLPTNLELEYRSSLYSVNKSLFLVTSGGVFKSTDRGQSFEAILEDFFVTSSTPVQLSENAAYYVNAGIPGLALSEDGFWFQTDLYFPAHFYARGYLLTNEKIFCYGIGGCFDLTNLEDETNLFASKNLPKVSLFTNRAKAGNELFATANSGLYHYDLNTKQWELAMDSLDLPFLFETPFFASRRDTTLMASSLGIHLWNAQEKTWELLENTPSIFYEATIKANNKYFYSLIDDEFFLWKGGKNDWQAVELPITSFFDDPIDVEFKGDTLFYLDEDKMAYSINLGKTWESRTLNISSLFRGKYVQTANSNLYVVVDEFFGNSSLYEMTINGLSKKEISIKNTKGQTLTVDDIFAMDDLLFARTTDFGSYSLYVSRDFGRTWQKVNLPSDFDYISGGTSTANQFFFATEKGVWSIAKSALNVLTSDLTTSNIKLASFFPNPSNGKFNLQTSLTELGNEPVQVSVFNTFGQKIRSYTTQLNGSTLELDLSSAQNGMYIIYLQAGSKAWKSQVVKTN